MKRREFLTVLAATVALPVAPAFAAADADVFTVFGSDSFRQKINGVASMKTRGS